MARKNVNQRIQKKQVKVQISTGQIPDLQYANGVLTNFSGSEFVVTFFQVLPPPYVNAEELPNEIEAKVISRVAVSPLKWAEAVDNFARQVAQLRGEGILPPAEIDETQE